MATQDNNNPSSCVSQKTVHIAGILTTIHGLEELSAPAEQPVACLWLLHPRLQTQECMAPIAAQAIAAWNTRLEGATGKGLIAVSFDQRNHGTRQVNAVANEAWRGGNARHAQDMFSIYHGTASDTSLLITHLAAYITARIVQHVVLGVSLGGHAAWLVALHEPRVTTVVSIIGCPDYTALMRCRAEKSKLPTAGSRFVGSVDFPPALVEAVAQHDPASLLMRRGSTASTELAAKLKGKRILSLSGGADKLVPYACSQPCLDFIKTLDRENPGRGLSLVDVVYDGVGHEATPAMLSRAFEFICESIEPTAPVSSPDR